MKDKKKPSRKQMFFLTKNSETEKRKKNAPITQKTSSKNTHL